MWLEFTVAFGLLKIARLAWNVYFVLCCIVRRVLVIYKISEIVGVTMKVEVCMPRLRNFKYKIVGVKKEKFVILIFLIRFLFSDLYIYDKFTINL